MKVSLSVVTYNTDIRDLEKVISSVVNTNQKNWTLYIIDNSPNDRLKDFCSAYDEVVYIFNNKNIGFGAAHNLALQKSVEAGFRYHFIVNPDIYFTGDILTPMIKFMDQDPQVGMMMPKVLYENGEIQFLPKLLPSPFWVVRRKLKRPRSSYNDFIDKYELRASSTKILNVPILSGCFTLINLKALDEVGGYDEKFFMYFEDFDLSRRMHEKYKTIYFPEVSVFHGYESGANKSFKLLKVFLSSALTYFNKWGWIVDKKRKSINAEALKALS